MASGLDNLFTTYGKDYGALGAFQSGQQRGLADAAVRLSNEQKMAETQRYTGETPSYLQKSQAQARSAELGNMQGEADAQAEVYGAKSQESLATANLKAAEAKKVLDNMPAKTKVEMMDQMGQKIEKFNQLGLQLLQFSGSTGEAIQRMAEAYPDIIKDQQFAQWAKQYGNMPREQALNAFKFEMQKYASGISTTREKFQTEALQEDQKQQGRMEVGKQQGQYGLQEAQTRAASAGADRKPSSDEFLYSQIQAANPNATPAQLAQLFVNAKTVVTKQTPSLLVPGGVATTTTTKGNVNTSTIPTVKSQADYDALPSGTTYKDPKGQTRTKQ